MKFHWKLGLSITGFMALLLVAWPWLSNVADASNKQTSRSKKVSLEASRLRRQQIIKRQESARRSSSSQTRSGSRDDDDDKKPIRQPPRRKRPSPPKPTPNPKPTPTPTPVPGVSQPLGSQYAVLAYNDLGMHCMNPDFGEFCLLPPFNNLNATVIRRGSEPKIVTNSSQIKVNYSIPGNTESASKTDFWNYALALFGVNPSPNVGITGNGLAGSMVASSTTGKWEATGIPVTDKMDSVNGNPPEINPFPVSLVEVRDKLTDTVLAWTKAVVPVSTEMACNTCHNTPGMTVEADILADHDRLHNTDLSNSKPVLCVSCHADPALGTAGKPGIPSMSHAMHGAHAPRMEAVKETGANTCYSCHPGNRTQCQRDIHSARGMSCVNCHGDEYAVGNTNRRPWVDEPQCGSCHKSRKPNFDFEPPGVLFRNAKGHGGVACAACHGSPHAITPTVTATDNEQALLLQGFAGVIRDCKVCHINTPRESFFHKIDD